MIGPCKTCWKKSTCEDFEPDPITSCSSWESEAQRIKQLEAENVELKRRLQDRDEYIDLCAGDKIRRLQEENKRLRDQLMQRAIREPYEIKCDAPTAEILKLTQENTALRKRLELKIHYPEPVIFWKDGVHAYANNTYIGRISIAAADTWSISIVPTNEKEWLGELSSKERAQDEFIRRWHEFWAKIHGGIKP